MNQQRQEGSLTMVVSVMEPKLLMKMLHVTLTGGPGRSRPRRQSGWFDKRG